MRIAHLADVHIRKLKYHTEYRAVFKQLYDVLRKEEVDNIVICGDLVHTKTDMSPEMISMVSWFLSSLADIAPTVVILGNHDGNLKNSGRLDALTPIVRSLDHPDLYLLKDSQEMKLKDGFYFNVLSVFDRENWVKPSNKDAVNIALYHGSVSSSKTDIGWTLEHTDDNITIFKDFDFAFLGDIHKTNQALDPEGRVRYPGSTIQQNHGETNDKGFLVWDIKDKEEFTVKHIPISNPKPFITIELTKKGRMPKNTSLPEGARLRLVSTSNLSLDAVRKAIDVAKHRFKPEAITYLNRAEDNANVSELAKNLVQEDLRNLKTQEKLISGYLEEYDTPEELLDIIFDLNKRYNTLAEQEEEVARNVNWRLRSVKWDNLFNYGSDNEIDFGNSHGILGVFGKNYSGKSSIVDSILYTLYNSTSKNVRKNLNFINQNKQSCVGEIEIDVGHNTYLIERTSEKYTKKLKGEVTLEAKTDVNFVKRNNTTGEVDSLNGLSRMDTDKNIKKVFGTIEDFLMTSMASQLGSLSFINEGSTRRKEILAKFLDLELFEKKFKLAKEEASEIRAALKRLEGRDFKEEIKLANEELVLNEIVAERKKKECELLSKDIEILAGKINDLNSVIDSIPAEIIDIAFVNRRIDEQEELLETVKEQSTEFSSRLSDNRDLLVRMEEFISSFDYASYEEKALLIQQHRKKIENFEQELKVLEMKFSHHGEKIELLDEVPCGDSFPSCKFIKDAYESKNEIGKVQVSIEELSFFKKEVEQEVSSLEPDKINEYLEKYDKLLEKRNEVQRSVNNTKLLIEKNKTKLLKTQSALKDLNDKKREYEDNKETIENLEELIKQKEHTFNKHVDFKDRYEKCNEETLELYKVHGSLEQSVKNLEQQQQEYITLQNEYSSIDLYLRCMHTNGISYDIIKKKLPIINEEISKILTNIVEFEIFFEEDGKKLDIHIKHPRHDPRPIEMGSGAEKTIAAMAIRLALLNVSTLPKSDIFILDEPGTALDEDNMEGFVRMLDMVKTQFKTVVLISHLDSLKDCVDSQLIIEKKDGYAYVSF